MRSWSIVVDSFGEQPLVEGCYYPRPIIDITPYLGALCFLVTVFREKSAPRMRKGEG